MSPEVAHNIKPFTIKIDIFSIGQILLEFLLKRELSLSEFIKLKQDNVFDIIPELKQHQNYEFVKEILANMVCHERKQRLKSIKLLQKLNQFQVDEESLKSLIFSNKSTQKINQESIQNQQSLNTKAEINQQLVTLPNNNDKKESNNNQYQKSIQLSSINLVEKKQIKSIRITNDNMNENLNLEIYQEVELDFNDSLAYAQKTCFCFGNLNIVNAIRKVQKFMGISTMIIDLKQLI
ncbi:hypothetical protein ABPG74_006721 [Tetrahymena malaccensis]